MTTQDLNALKEQAAAIQAQINAAEKAERAKTEEQIKAEQKLKYVARQKETLATLAGYAEALMTALIAKNVEHTYHQGAVSKDGNLAKPYFNNYGTTEVSFTERYRGGTAWRTGTFVGWNIVVGMHGDRKVFPPLAKGGHNYDAVAEELKVRHQRNIRKTEEHNAFKRMEAEAEQVVKELGCGQVKTGRHYGDRWRQCTPYIELGLENAKALVAKLKGEKCST